MTILGSMYVQFYRFKMTIQRCSIFSLKSVLTKGEDFFFFIFVFLVRLSYRVSENLDEMR